MFSAAGDKASSAKQAVGTETDIRRHRVVIAVAGMAGRALQRAGPVPCPAHSALRILGGAPPATSDLV
jgi:hypothetical protein